MVFPNASRPWGVPGEGGGGQPQQPRFLAGQPLQPPTAGRGTPRPRLPCAHPPAPLPLLIERRRCRRRRRRRNQADDTNDAEGDGRTRRPSRRGGGAGTEDDPDSRRHKRRAQGGRRPPTPHLEDGGDARRGRRGTIRGAGTLLPDTLPRSHPPRPSSSPLPPPPQGLPLAQVVERRSRPGFQWLPCVPRSRSAWSSCSAALERRRRLWRRRHDVDDAEGGAATDQAEETDGLRSPSRKGGGGASPRQGWAPSPPRGEGVLKEAVSEHNCESDLEQADLSSDGTILKSSLLFKAAPPPPLRACRFFYISFVMHTVTNTSPLLS